MSNQLQKAGSTCSAEPKFFRFSTESVLLYANFFTFALHILGKKMSQALGIQLFKVSPRLFCFDYLNYKALHLIILLLLVQVELCDIGQQECFNNNQDAEEGGTLPPFFF